MIFNMFICYTKMMQNLKLYSVLREVENMLNEVRLFKH